MANARQHSKHFLAREDDGSVRLRMRFQSEEASLFEEAAGETPIIEWMHKTLNTAARKQVRAARARREPISAPPPN